jgi:hypothetical protein
VASSLTLVVAVDLRVELVEMLHNIFEGPRTKLTFIFKRGTVSHISLQNLVGQLIKLKSLVSLRLDLSRNHLVDDCGCEVGRLGKSKSLVTTLRSLDLDLSTNVALTCAGRWWCAGPTAMLVGLCALEVLHTLRLNLNFTAIGNDICLSLGKLLETIPTITDLYLNVGNNVRMSNYGVRNLCPLFGARTHQAPQADTKLLRLHLNLSRLIIEEWVWESLKREVLTGYFDDRHGRTRELNLCLDGSSQPLHDNGLQVSECVSSLVAVEERPRVCISANEYM